MEHELLKQADKVMVAWMLGCISDYDGSPALEPEDVELGKLNTMAMQCISDDVKHIAFVWGMEVTYGAGLAVEGRFYVGCIDERVEDVSTDELKRQWMCKAYNDLATDICRTLGRMPTMGERKNLRVLACYPAGDKDGKEVF